MTVIKNCRGLGLNREHLLPFVSLLLLSSTSLFCQIVCSNVFVNWGAR